MVEDLIRALIKEVEGQPKVLQGFMGAHVPRARRGAILAGAGDSYAAALAGYYASGGRCLALDPYVLASAPEFAEGADVFLISASGRTAANILAARRVRSHARRVVAVTTDADSRLARASDRTVELPMTYAPRTPGMLSFGLSLLAVMKIVGEVGACDFASALREARKSELAPADFGGTTYFLGNHVAHATSLYVAAKVHEISGARAQAELLEEFSHLELFSLAKEDVVNAFSNFDPAGVAHRLGRALRERGYRFHAVRNWGRTPMERLFHDVFTSQLSVLRQAEGSGVTAPAFLSARGALEASDSMIY